ncbi:MAG: 2-oxo acid dehydrogenase subunit E2 [Deltaproteobacteria bacterium]|nr:2-oxo acid dehydrogenase subunit E2 [Deltaproteobacteria bacterium]
MPNLELELKTGLSTFRRIALGTWRTTGDPSVYGSVDVRMDSALRYIEEFRQKTGRRLTVTHLVARAIAQVLKETPDANALLRFSRIYLRKRIGVFLQVAMTDQGEGKVDLSGVTVYDVAERTLVELVDDVQTKVELVRQRSDPHLERSRKLMDRIPSPLIGPALSALSFLTLGLNLDLSRFGIPRDPFGSVMVTNVGSLGLDTAFVPLIPYSRVPILIAVSAVKDTPVVEDGKVVPAKVMRLNATFDHRFIDGYHAATMSKTVRAWLEHPYDHFDAL